MAGVTAVEWNPEASRYDLAVDGAPAGHAEVRIHGDTITFTHTRVDQAFQGQGLARVLARDALADAARRYRRIVPRCPYIAKYLRKHDVPGAIVEWPE